MPTAMIKKFAKETGKSKAEVERLWNDCKKSVKKKHAKEDDQYWAMVTGCLKQKLGIHSVSAESEKILAWKGNGDE